METTIYRGKYPGEAVCSVLTNPAEVGIGEGSIGQLPELWWMVAGTQQLAAEYLHKSYTRQ